MTRDFNHLDGETSAILSQQNADLTTDEGKTTEALTWWGLAGFELWQTGGGCEAFALTVDHYHILVTTDGCAFPTRGDKIEVGIYDDTDDFSEDLEYRDEFATFKDALEFADDLATRYADK